MTFRTDTDDAQERERRAAIIRGAFRRDPRNPVVPSPQHPSARVDPTDWQRITQALDSAVGRLTAVVTDQLGLSLNSVLLQERVVIPPEGYTVRSFSGALAFVAVWNDSTNPVTVSESTPGAAARTSGIGVVVVRPSCAKGVAMTGSDVTLYATAGTTFDLAVYSRPLPPFAGPA